MDLVMRYRGTQQEMFIVSSDYLSVKNERLDRETSSKQLVSEPLEMTTYPPDLKIAPETTIGQTEISVPAILQSELKSQYEELGKALNELAEMDDDEWHVDPGVYHVACYAASSLMDNGFPAPQVFTHGPKSVVFNWLAGSRNLYLTLSRSVISALISTPKSVEHRLQFTVAQLESPETIFPSIELVCFGREAVTISASTRN
jgi:hypothetical protein